MSEELRGPMELMEYAAADVNTILFNGPLQFERLSDNVFYSSCNTCPRCGLRAVHRAPLQVECSALQDNPTLAVVPVLETNCNDESPHFP